MKTDFRRAIVPGELGSLVRFDHKAFKEYPADWFDREYWASCEAWWMIVDGRKAGCCAFERHLDFREDIDGRNHWSRGSLYIVSTAILPGLQRRGYGTLLKSWQVAFARHHGFVRIITNHRQSNRRIIRLNQALGFKIIRTSARNYYDDPAEPTVVMERRL